MKAAVLPTALLLAAAGLGATSASAAGTDVSYKSGGETVHGIVYAPEGKGPHPGIVVIHEWWGLTDWVKDQAAELAKQGYVALAIDLYRGKVATDPEAAHELARGLPEDRAVRDLKAAFTYLKGRKDVNGKIGVIGWCMGGGYALALALNEPRVTATVINYGRLATDPAAIGKIHGPVLGIFGGKDRGITPDDVHAFEAEMKKLGKKIDVVIYPDAGHAFENPNNKDGYRADDAADAAKRTKAFLATALK
jgi:carboxymethylenebutenolidase